MTEQVSAPTRLLDVDVQYALATSDSNDSEEPPSPHQLTEWAQSAYSAVCSTPSETTIRVVDTQEITQLNRDYRDKDKPTNILSFSFEIDPDIELALLGDIVIAHDVIVSEAQAQNKSTQDHYAHIVTHGVLHLCGYDHEEGDDAEKMESLEIAILAKQGIANPYS